MARYSEMRYGLAWAACQDNRMFALVGAWKGRRRVLIQIGFPWLNSFREWRKTRKSKSRVT